MHIHTVACGFSSPPRPAPPQPFRRHDLSRAQSGGAIGLPVLFVSLLLLVVVLFIVIMCIMIDSYNT